MNDHTPGPWRVSDLIDENPYPISRIRAISMSGGVLAHVNDQFNGQGNARLIGAAPDLLAALRMVCDSGVPLAEPIEKAMLAAIEKAEGV